MRVFARPRESSLNCFNVQHFFSTLGRLGEIELFSFRFHAWTVTVISVSPHAYNVFRREANRLRALSLFTVVHREKREIRKWPRT